MNILRKTVHAAASLCVLLLASCLESHEEVWLNADASGAARFKVSMPLTPTKLHGGEKGIRKMITEYVEKSGAFSSYKLESSTSEDRLYLDLYVTFKNALDLQKANSPEALQNLPASSTAMMGTTSVGFEGLNVSYKRSMDLSKALPAARFLPKKSIREFNLTTIIHLPEAPVSHNASSTENNGRTLIWVVPLEMALTGPHKTQFVMPIPIPWMTVGIAALVILLLVTLLIYYIYRRKRRAAAAAT